MAAAGEIPDGDGGVERADRDQVAGVRGGKVSNLHGVDPVAPVCEPSAPRARAVSRALTVNPAPFSARAIARTAPSYRAAVAAGLSPLQAMAVM